MNNYVLLHQPGKGSAVGVGAEGWSDRPDPTVLIPGGVNPALRPLPGSLSAGGHVDVDEEADDETVLLWVNCSLGNQSGVIVLFLNPPACRYCELTCVGPWIAAWVFEN